MREIGDDLDNKEKTSEKVAESMADIINKRFSEGLSDGKLKERQEKYQRPENCTKLVVPKVNKEIWKNLPTATKQNDAKLAAIQRTIIKATSALAQSTQEILKAYKSKKLTDKETKEKMTDKNADAIAMLGHACHELSMKRRFSIRPQLPKHLTGLCGESVPITSQLFGDNLTGTIKEIKELDRLSTPRANNYRARNQDGRNYNNKTWQRHSNKDRKPFLGQRQNFGGNFKKKPAKPFQRK